MIVITQIIIFALCVMLVMTAMVVYILERKKEGNLKKSTIWWWEGFGLALSFPLKFRNMTFRKEIIISIIILLISIPIIVVVFITGLHRK